MDDDPAFAEVLKIPGVASIRHNDVRFGWPNASNGQLLIDFVTDLRNSPDPEARCAGKLLLERVHASFHFDYPTEVRSIAAALCEAAGYSGDALATNARFIAERFGVGTTDTQIEALARRNGISFSGIWQRTDPPLKLARWRRPASLAMSAFVHRLSERHLVGIQSIEAAESEWLQGSRLRDAIRFADKVLGIPVPDLTKARRTTKSLKAVLSVASPAVHSALVIARRHIERSGACNLAMLAGQLSLEGAPVDARAAIERQAEVKWLGKERAWFTLCNVDDVAIFSRIRKLLAVAANGVSIREVCEVIVSDSRWVSESGEGFVVPPQSILDDAIALQPWARRAGNGFWVPSDSHPGLTVLTDAERAVEESIRRRGGIALIADVVSDCVAGGQHLASVRALMTTTPIVRPVLHGVVCIRGRPVDVRVATAVVAASMARRMKFAVTPVSPY